MAGIVIEEAVFLLVFLYYMKPFALSDSEAHWYTLHERTAHRDGNKKRFHRAIVRRRLDQAADRLLEEAFKLAF